MSQLRGVTWQRVGTEVLRRVTAHSLPMRSVWSWLELHSARATTAAISSGIAAASSACA